MGTRKQAPKGTLLIVISVVTLLLIPLGLQLKTKHTLQAIEPDLESPIQLESLTLTDKTNGILFAISHETDPSSNQTSSPTKPPLEGCLNNSFVDFSSEEERNLIENGCATSVNVSCPREPRRFSLNDGVCRERDSWHDLGRIACCFPDWKFCSTMRNMNNQCNEKECKDLIIGGMCKPLSPTPWPTGILGIEWPCCSRLQLKEYITPAPELISPTEQSRNNLCRAVVSISRFTGPGCGPEAVITCYNGKSQTAFCPVIESRNRCIDTSVWEKFAHQQCCGSEKKCSNKTPMLP